MRRIQYILFSIWIIIVISYVLGVTLTMANVEKFLVFENQFSLFGSIVELATEPNVQNIFLLLIIVTFTFIFPIAKLMTMYLQIKNHGDNWQNRMTKFIEAIGHFSMLDVFIIALMVLLLKLRVLVDVTIYAGFYWFTLSIVLSILLSFTIKHLRKKAAS